MDPVRNPFAPGAGSPPPELTGREDILAKATVTLARIRDGRPSKSFLMIGLRGVGKTVLLNRISEIAEDSGFKVFMIEAHENKSLPELLVPPLRQLLFALDRYENVNEHVKRALRVLKSFARGIKVKVGEFDIGLDIDPERGAADSGDLESDLPELLLAVARAASARGTAAGVIIDEMQYLNEIELSALIMAIHRVAQKQLPLVLVGAGLPQLVGLTGRSKSYAERLFDFPAVDALDPNAARKALQQPVQREDVHFTSDALDEIVRITEGYPYFLQEWGYHTWNLARTSPIELATVRAAYATVIQRLDESFFRVRFDRLTPRERDYLRAMAELGPGAHRSGDIAEMLHAGVRAVAPLRNTLIRKGMIYSPQHGDTAFTVPLFDQFMKRIMPEMRSR